MKLWEFIVLILGVLSLIHYISYSEFRIKNYSKFVSGIYKENSNVAVIRFIELGIIIIIINIGVWLYKILF